MVDTYFWHNNNFPAFVFQKFLFFKDRNRRQSLIQLRPKSDGWVRTYFSFGQESWLYCRESVPPNYTTHVHCLASMTPAVPTPHKKVHFHRINPLEEWVAPAIQVSWPCSQLKCHKRSGSSKKAIQVSRLFRRILPEPPLFPCSSIDWTTVFCIGKNPLQQKPLK